MPGHGCNDGLAGGFVDLARHRVVVNCHVITCHTWRVIHINRLDRGDVVRAARPTLNSSKARDLQQYVPLLLFLGLTRLGQWKSRLVEGTLQEVHGTGSGNFAMPVRWEKTSSKVSQEGMTSDRYELA